MDLVIVHVQMPYIQFSTNHTIPINKNKRQRLFGQGYHQSGKYIPNATAVERYNDTQQNQNK